MRSLQGHLRDYDQPENIRGKKVSDAISLSVVIPVGPDDHLWKGLIADLRHLSRECEILIVGVDDEPANFRAVWGAQLLSGLHWIKSEQGRAKQLNRGAREANGRNILFLHADSKFPRATMNLVSETIKLAEEAVYHFDLQFLTDGPKLVQLNSIFANWRARVLKMPFGDQGFLMSKLVFEMLGGFSEGAAYGEDQLLIWEARRLRIPVKRLPGVVFTSARRYQKNGWSRATGERMWLTTKQAVSEGMKLMKDRLTDI